MRRLLHITFQLFITLTVFAQNTEEKVNKGVFNKIEYFINTQMTDSIYNLASDTFKEQISVEHLGFVLSNLYQLGKITDSKPLSFEKDIATYELQFDQNYLHLKLGLDKDIRFHTLLFEPSARPKPILQQQVESSNKTERVVTLDMYIDSLANSYLKKNNTQSLSIALFHKNKYKTFFYGETDNQELPTEESIYEIGSITKLFTSVLLAELVNKKTILLEGSIAKYLPDSVSANPDIKAITFKSLANHTSGLPRLPNNWNTGSKFNDKDPYANYTTQDLYTFLKNYKADQQNIDTYNYSNLGFGLLGELISTITGKPYMEYLHEVILTPLSLSNTSDQVDQKNAPFFSKVYDQNGLEVPTWSWQAMLAAGGLKSTIKDLMIFSLEQLKMTETDLQYAMALTRQFTAFGPNSIDVGLGWHMSMFDGLIFFHHAGGTGGSSSYMAISPDTKTVLVALSNSANSVDHISNQLMEKLLSSDN